jgi:hypothetical protein
VTTITSMTFVPQSVTRRDGTSRLACEPLLLHHR